ncbi:MAG: hypothetical protein V4674_00375 [Patescibacteria group bacterium]
MTFLLIMAVCSFVAMFAVVWQKLVLVRAEEYSHHEHVGLAHVVAPLVEGSRRYFKKHTDTVWVKVKPYVAAFLFKAGSWLHRTSMRISEKMHALAARIKGKGGSHPGNRSIFARDME